MKCTKEVCEGFRWKIGNGAHLSLWFDNWTGNGPLSDLIDDDIEDDEILLTLSHVIDVRGEWDFSGVRTPIPPAVMSMIERPYLRTLMGQIAGFGVLAPMANRPARVPIIFSQGKRHSLATLVNGLGCGKSIAPRK